MQTICQRTESAAILHRIECVTARVYQLSWPHFNSLLRRIYGTSVNEKRHLPCLLAATLKQCDRGRSRNNYLKCIHMLWYTIHIVYDAKLVCGVWTEKISFSLHQRHHHQAAIKNPCNVIIQFSQMAPPQTSATGADVGKNNQVPKTNRTNQKHPIILPIPMNVR